MHGALHVKFYYQIFISELQIWNLEKNNTFERIISVTVCSFVDFLLKWGFDS